MFSFEALSYRDNEGGLRLRRAQLLDERRAELDETGPAVERVYARRISRMVGGAVAIAGASLMVLAAAGSKGAAWLFGSALLDASLTPILVATVVAAAVATILARIVAIWHAHVLLMRDLAETDDVRADLERLTRRSPSERLAERADSLETKSVWAPLVGIALVTPLALHLVVGFLMTPDVHSLVRDFDWWILVSLCVTIPAHGVLAWQCVSFAKKLRTSTKPPSVWAPYGWTVLAGFFPGVILFLVPPVLVAITGVVFVPAMLATMRKIVHAERATLDA
jgi:hypothetical protein